MSPITRNLWCLAPLLLGLACDRGPSKEEALAEASMTVTLGTLTLLGPHQLESTISRQQGERITVETLVLTWGDPDNFQVRRMRDGRPNTEVRVIGGKAWQRQGEGRFAQYDDAELFRVDLGSTWNTWSQALDPFAGRVLLQEPEDAVVEGRPATRYTVSLAQATQPLRRKAHEPLDLSGWVVVDQATALRLQAELEGRYLENGKPDRERVVRLTQTVVNIGTPPQLEAPKRAR